MRIWFAPRELPSGISMDRKNKRLFIGCRTDKYTVVENVKTQTGARTMALDPKTHKVFLSVGKYEPTPAPSAGAPRSRRTMVPGNFSVLVFGPWIRKVVVASEIGTHMDALRTFAQQYDGLWVWASPINYSSNPAEVVEERDRRNPVRSGIRIIS